MSVSEDEIVELIMSTAPTADAAKATLEVVREWLEQDGLSDAARYRVRYQADHLVLLLPQGPLDPPD